jgi:hypothetical protein
MRAFIERNAAHHGFSVIGFVATLTVSILITLFGLLTIAVGVDSLVDNPVDMLSISSLSDFGITMLWGGLVLVILSNLFIALLVRPVAQPAT